VLRIIAGKYKGSKLQLPSELITRPSSSRLREAVFNILSARINWNEAVICDAFSGSGAMGLEALSRGASSVVFCEKSPDTFIVLRKNIKHLLKDNQNGITLYKNFFIVDSKNFDLIFLDPPYGEGFAEKSLEYIYSKQLLKTDGIVVLEESKGSNTIYSGFEIFERRIYGNCQVSFYNKV
jgi:16S rRNA (guanine966-N2)-methyltransferase